ncbi:putative trichodiene synthase [Diaporthe ampelina]|uniref:Putative trichodiene synthase n=1 Tax=Diaporthe ampelina TaxID=1214573 RepID=A0A0G2IES6_9PEZI|nr:putative trichodiene synthase [Diaporthe ampelina]
MQAKPRVLQAAINAIMPLIVYSWAKVSIGQMADLSVQFTFALLLDDSNDGRGAGMESFFQDLVEHLHRPQRNAHYGPFCSLSLFRSALDWSTCAHNHPQFLRRLNGLGQFVGASLFPGTQARERELMLQITSAMPHLEHFEIFVNDVGSVYQEFDRVDGQATLVRNYVRCGPQVSIKEGLDHIASDAIARSEILRRAFCDNKDMDPHVAARVEAFYQGYFTWHLSDPPYRLRELGDRGGDSAAARRFRDYLVAGAQAAVDAEHWAYPSIAVMAEA